MLYFRLKSNLKEGFMKRKKKYSIWRRHVDCEWIDQKIEGHGGCYSFNSTRGLATIHFIFGKNKIQILWYNIILLFKYLARKMRISRTISSKMV
jgi:hypothetical protein